jgi:SAM-dependent methyltransferase
VIDPEHPLRRRLRAARRRLSSPDQVWERALPSELAFWQSYIENEGREYPDEFRQRLDPDAPITDPILLDAIDLLEGDAVRIIDVGAGPLTSVGRRNPRRPAQRVELTAVDPLADGYNELLERAGITPPTRTLACRGEEVAARFGSGAFDVAYARNSLDHSVDAMAAVQNLVEVVRTGGVVAMIHGRREGETHDYEQLHQWNFDVRDGRLVLYSRRAFYDVAERLGAAVEVASRVWETPHGPFVSATIVRRG